MHDHDEDLLIDFVSRALDDVDAGRTVDLQALCAERPDLVPAVAEALGLRSDLGDLTRASRDRDPMEGRVLAGRYRLESSLGRGAMGIVHLARDLTLDRRVAVKTFDDRFGAADDPVRSQRFLREARSLAALNHPHVVAIHDHGRDEEHGTLFVVMELLHGASLADLMSGSGPNAARLDAQAAHIAHALGTNESSVPESTWLRCACHWLGQVAEGLEAAHAAGLVHRDVKPSNIWIRRDGQALLLDFGIAVRADDPALTQSESALGTPWYMAPEQARGTDRATDPRIDVYGLAATLYHLVTGQPPYEGDGRQVVASLLECDPLPPSKVMPGLPRDLAAILEKGMERDPRRRYPSAAAMARDLRAFLEHRPTEARPLGRTGRLARGVRRHPLRAGLAVAGFLLALAVFAVVYLLPAWEAEQARIHRARVFALRAQVPPNLAIEGRPAQRLHFEASTRAADLDLLDRILALEPDDFVTRLWRASLRLDQGERGPATDDIDMLAASRPDDPLLAELATRYARAADTPPGIEAVDLSDLPAPTTALGRVALGFHLLRLRAGKADDAVELLTAAVDELPRARVLLTVALIDKGDEQQDLASFAAAARLADELREERGADTAFTAFATGVDHLVRRDYSGAIPWFERAERLCPDRHGPVHNLAVAHRRLKDPERAMTLLRRARELGPTHLNTAVTIAQTLTDLGRFDECLELARTLPDDGTGERVWREQELTADARFTRACEILRTGDPDAKERARPDFDAAVEGFGKAANLLDSGDPRLARRMRTRASIAQALADDRSPEALDEFLNQLRGSADDPYQIANLELLLEDRPLDVPTVRLLRRYLLRLSRDLGRLDTGLVQRMATRDSLVRKLPDLPEPPKEDR